MQGAKMQMRRLMILLAVTGSMLILNVPVLAIGNANYAHASRLANLLNDAQDVGAALVAWALR